MNSQLFVFELVTLLPGQSPPSESLVPDVPGLDPSTRAADQARLEHNLRQLMAKVFDWRIRFSDQCPRAREAIIFAVRCCRLIHPARTYVVTVGAILSPSSHRRSLSSYHGLHEGSL